MTFQRKHLPAHLNPEKTKIGHRPTEYRPEYCQAVIEAARLEGLSLTAFAGTILVSAHTVYEWIKNYPEFSDAVSRAKPARVAYLERKLMRSRKGAETQAASFALKNAAPEEWRDVRTTQYQVSFNPRQLTDEQLNAIAAGASPADVGVIDGEFSRQGEREIKP